MANWVIVGTGALSTLWAHGLQAAGANVVLYSRHEEDRKGVALAITQHLHEAAEGDKVCAQTRQFSAIGSVSDAPDDAIWLVMVKAWQVQPLLTELAAQGLTQATLILSHNGMGAGTSVLAAEADWQIYDLVTTHGAWRKSRTHSMHAGLGESWLGKRHIGADSADGKSGSVEPPPWFVELAKALPPLHWEHDILHRRWQKLAINCAINPLATLAGADNGELRNDEYQPKIRAICEEIANVNPALDADALVKQVHQVAAATATNRCSMLQDLTAGRRTEIAFLNGFICREGERLHVATRANCELVRQIQQLELLRV